MESSYHTCALGFNMLTPQRNHFRVAFFAMLPRLIQLYQRMIKFGWYQDTFRFFYMNMKERLVNPGELF